MLGVPGPVEGRFDNAPAHLIICSSFFSTKDHAGNSQAHCLTDEEVAIKGAKHKEALAREETRQEARRLVNVEKAKQKAMESMALQAISLGRQRVKREAMGSPPRQILSDEDRKAHKRELNRIGAERLRFRKLGLAEDTKQRLLALIPEGWMNMAQSAKVTGISDATASKYSKLGLLHGIKTPGGTFIDPEELRSIFQSRQKSHMNYLKDHLHEVFKSRYPFCETVDQ